MPLLGMMTVWCLQIALAVALQGVGGLGFDKLTKTNTVTKLLQVQSASDSFYAPVMMPV